MLATTACGHTWVTDPPTHDHLCRRTSPDHRSHECDCLAIELKTSSYQRAASLVDGAAPSPWSVELASGLAAGLSSGLSR